MKSKGRVQPHPDFEEGLRYMRVVQAVADSRARNVRVVFFAYGVKKGEKPDFDIVEKEPEGGSVFFLTSGEESTSYHAHNKGVPLTARDVAEVVSGNVVIYAFGKIYYRDTPKCSHWTTFCTFYIPSLKRYSNYSEYNDTDEVKCNGL